MQLPFADAGLDVVIIFKVLCYRFDAARFAPEYARVLRSGKVVLVSNANKHLFDFNASPYSHAYHDAAVPGVLFSAVGFSTRILGRCAGGQRLLVAKVAAFGQALYGVRRLVATHHGRQEVAQNARHLTVHLQTLERTALVSPTDRHENIPFFP